MKQVSQDRHFLADLKRAIRDSPDDPQSLFGVRRLESFITEDSKMSEMAQSLNEFGSLSVIPRPVLQGDGLLSR